MSTGETSPWARGAAPAGAPPPPTYDGPWDAPTPAAPPWSPAPSSPSSPPWSSPAPWPQQQPWPGSSPSDEQLSRLPPPAVRPLVPGPPVEQRPAVIGLAATLAVTGSLLWVCGLSLFLLLAAAGTQALGPAGEDGVLFHLLDDVLLRMGDGLWVPLYGFPVASLVTGFCLLARRPWTRIAHTVVGAAALGWSAWWLRDSLLAWVVVVVYVGTAVAVLWVPSANRWYRRTPRRPDGPEGVRLTG